MNRSIRIDAETADEIARAAALRSALRRFAARTESVSGVTGISSEHYNLLLILQAAELAGTPMSVSELTDGSSLQQTAVRDFLAGAERAGLVNREQSGSRGTATLCLTPEGRRRLVAAFVALRQDRAELARTVHALAGSPVE